MIRSLFVLVFLSANNEPTWLGLRLMDNPERDCVVVDVAAGPAKDVLRSGDCVVSLNGQPTRRAEDLIRLASTLRPPEVAQLRLSDARVVEVVPSVRPKNSDQLLCEAAREVRTEVMVVRGHPWCDSVSTFMLRPHATVGDVLDRLGDRVPAPSLLVGMPRCGDSVKTVASPSASHELWTNSTLYFCKNKQQSSKKR